MLPEGRGPLFGRAGPNEVLNYWTPVKKRARLSTRTEFLTSGNFSYYTGSVARWFAGVTGGAWAFIWAGIPQGVIELLDAGGKTGPFVGENWASNV